MKVETKKETFRETKKVVKQIILPIGVFLIVLGLCGKLSLFLFGEANLLFILLVYFLFVFLIISVYCVVSNYVSEREHCDKYGDH